MPSASPPAIERSPEGSLMCILGGNPRESEREKEKKKKKRKKKKTNKLERKTKTKP